MYIKDLPNSESHGEIDLDFQLSSILNKARFSRASPKCTLSKGVTPGSHVSTPSDRPSTNTTSATKQARHKATWSGVQGLRNRVNHINLTDRSDIQFIHDEAG